MSRILKNAHKSAKRLHAAGFMDEATRREFDTLCLTPRAEYTAVDVVRIRTKTRASKTSKRSRHDRNGMQ